MLHGCLGIYHLSLVSFFHIALQHVFVKVRNVGFSFLIVQRLGSIFLEMVAQKTNRRLATKDCLFLLECPKKMILAICWVFLIDTHLVGPEKVGFRGMNLPKVLMEGLTPSRPTWGMSNYMCQGQKSFLFWGEWSSHIGNPYVGYTNPTIGYPLLHGNNRSLDLSTYTNFNTFLFCSFAIFQNIRHAFSTEVLRCSAIGMCRGAYLEVTAAST